MSLTEYEDFVYGTCFVDKENPIVEWNRVRENQRLIDWLDGKRNGAHQRAERRSHAVDCRETIY